MNPEKIPFPSDAELDRTLHTMGGDLSASIDHASGQPALLRAQLGFVSTMLAEVDPLPMSAALLWRRPGGRVEAALVENELVVGRGEDCRLKITGDGEVGRKHFRVIRQGDTYLVEDLESRNGTFVNDEACRITQRRLRSGDVLLVGSNTILVFFADQTAIEATSADLTGPC